MHDPKAHQMAADVAGRFVLLRQWLGHSRAEMATRLGMSTEAYAIWEEPAGLEPRQCSVAFLTTLDAATGVSLDWLLCGNPPSRVPLDRRGRPMRPRLRVVGGSR